MYGIERLERKESRGFPFFLFQEKGGGKSYVEKLWLLYVRISQPNIFLETDLLTGFLLITVQ
jgi:hypothetical protein